MNPDYDYTLRDRILLYLTGLGMDDLPGLEIAAECLRRAGPGAEPDAAMGILRDLLAERDVVLCRVEPEGRLRSFPPFRRQTMVSRWTSGFSLYEAAKRLAIYVIGADATGKSGRAGRKGA